MKKILILLLSCTMAFNCASTFGTAKGGQSEEQRKKDKIVSKTVLGVLLVGAVILVAKSND